MGYSGPPSKACLGCRQRRIKCDLATPACNQCSRAGKVCQGYRTEIDFLFRDETKAITGKARRRKPMSTFQTSIPDTQPHASHVLVLSAQASTVSNFAHSLTMCRSQSPPFFSPLGSAEEQAICFFFSIYVTLQPTKRRRSFYAHLPKLYNVEADNHILKYIIPAIGLGGLSHRRSDPGLLRAAEAAYNKALCWTNYALCHLGTARSDQTLISVLLLGLYETDICCKARSSKNWLRHVQGASTLLELRGKDQLRTELGRQLFEYLRTQILSKCALARCPTPQVITELSKECEKYRECPMDDLVLISSALGQLRSENPFHPRVSDFESVDRGIISRCESITAELEAWKLRLIPALSPSGTTIESPRPDVFGGYHDVYRDTWTAGICNQYRTLCVLVSELAVNRLLNLERKGLITENQIWQLQNFRLNLNEHVCAICASVRYLLDSGCIEAAKSLLWPLYVAAQLNPWIVTLNSAIREWMVQQLSIIGHEKGVRQSLFLADTLLKREEVSDLLEEYQACSEDEGDKQGATPVVKVADFFSILSRTGSFFVSF